jgi:hypothetical protein
VDDSDAFEFRVRILARCIGSGLGLGRPIRIRIHCFKSSLQNTTRTEKS